MDINIRHKGCQACVEEVQHPSTPSRIRHNHQERQYSMIMDDNDNSIWVNPKPWSSDKLRIGKGKSRDEYWQEDTF